MLVLLLSLVALACGPLLATVLSRTPRAHDFLDGLVLVALCGLVLVHVLPHAVGLAGGPALLAAALGFLMPYGLERLTSRGSRLGAHRFLVPVVATSFGVHGFIDGAALVDHASEAAAPASVIALAIVLHRFPDGLAIWSVVRPMRGARAALVVLGALGVLTIVGFVAGGPALDGRAAPWIALLQSFVAGSVLHVIVHGPHGTGAHGHAHDHDHDRDHRHTGDEHIHGLDPSRSLHGLAATAGLALLVVVTKAHPIVSRETGELAATTTFVSLALEAAPALVVAVAVSALVHAFLPHGSRAWLARGGLFSQAARGVALAPVLPQCSCGAVPLYRTLVSKGTPVAAALALLIATPELGVPTLLVSSTLLGVPLTFARVAAAVVAALAVATFVARFVPTARTPSPPDSVRPPAQPAARRLLDGLADAVTDVVDHTGPWLVVGLAVGAMLEPLTRGDLIASVPHAAQVPLMAVAGMPLYVCASGATPLVAILVHKGLSPGAGIAFLVTGPASNVTTLGVLAKLHGRAVAVAYVAAITVVAVALGVTIDATLAPGTMPSLHEAAGGDAWAWWNVAALAVVAGLFLRSVVRLGPRRWFGQVLTSAAA